MNSRLVRGFQLGILIFASLNVVGCPVVQNQKQGSPIDFEKVAQIQRGKTTESEITALFGKPTIVQQRSSGRRLLIYESLESNIESDIWWSGKATLAGRGTALHVLTDKGVVLDYTTTEKTMDSEQPTNI